MTYFLIMLRLITISIVAILYGVLVGVISKNSMSGLQHALAMISVMGIMGLVANLFSSEDDESEKGKRKDTQENDPAYDLWFSIRLVLAVIPGVILAVVTGKYLVSWQDFWLALGTIGVFGIVEYLYLLYYYRNKNHTSQK